MAETDAKRGKKGASDVYLVADARERAVLPFLETELQDHAYVVKQVNTGDYLICRKPRGAAEPSILAVVERKTHADFAASLKDGRHANVKKMLALRASTGCQVYYFVEGPAFPSPNRRFARIPFANILAAITRMMVRDGVLVVQTEDEAHTAKRLADFLRVFDDVTPHKPAAPPAPPAANADGGDASGDADGAADDGPLAVPEVLMGRIEESDADAAVTMWARLRGVSVVFGKILTREFSVAELAAQRVPAERIQALRTATGRALHKDAASSLLAVRAGSKPHAVKLVSGLRGVTPAVATLVLDAAGGLAALCSWGVGALAMVALPQKNRTIRLGKARATRIRQLLHFREGGDAPADGPAGHVLGRAPTPARAPERKGPTPRGSPRAADATEADPLDLVYGVGAPAPLAETPRRSPASPASPALPATALPDDALDAVLRESGFL